LTMTGRRDVPKFAGILKVSSFKTCSGLLVAPY
jgi:hypothetical protein